MFLILGLLVACDTQEESAKDQVIVVPKHVSPQKDDFEKKSFYCCSDASLQPLMESYLKLTETLANDDTKNAATHAQEFLSLAETQPSLQKESTSLKPLWTEMDTIRSTLSDISTQMIELAKKQKSEKGTKIAVAFCPMAPGRWLQTRDEVHNPYYGSKMLKCGVFE